MVREIKMATIGNLKAFDPASDLWEVYTERLEQYFVANDIAAS